MSDGRWLDDTDGWRAISTLPDKHYVDVLLYAPANQNGLHNWIVCRGWRSEHGLETPYGTLDEATHWKPIDLPTLT